MQTKPTHVPTLRTETPGIYRRANRFAVKWNEDGKTCWRSFPTYEGACAFKRDYVLPYRERRGLPPSAIAPEKRGGGWIYVFQSGGPGQPVKLGYSADPARRLKDLRGAHPHALDLVLLVPGTPHLERLAHRLAGDFRMEGEWFSREALGLLVRSFSVGIEASS
jgi:hypothetical protein